MKPHQFFVFLAMTLLWVLNGGAQASTKWETITLNDQGMFSIDPKSITEDEGRKTVWTALDYKKQQRTAEGKAYRSTHAQIKINCGMKM